MERVLLHLLALVVLFVLLNLARFISLSTSSPSDLQTSQDSMMPVAGLLYANLAEHFRLARDNLHRHQQRKPYPDPLNVSTKFTKLARQSPRPPKKLRVMCLVVKDEAPFIMDWISFQSAWGIQSICHL